MEIFWRLFLGHMIGDFTLQTNYIAAWKRKNFTGLLVHCAIHPILYIILLWNYISQVWVHVGPVELTGCACIAIIFITHVIEDEWRIWSVLKKGAPDSSFFFAWDQIIHYAIIYALSPAINGAMSKSGLFYFPPITGVLPLNQALHGGVWERFLTVTRPEHWVFIAILYTVVTQFATVTIYFIEKDFFGYDFPATKEKYVPMLERVIVMSCFLLPGYGWLCVAGVWLARALICRIYRINNSTWTNLILGNGFAIGCGLLARYFLYL